MQILLFRQKMKNLLLPMETIQLVIERQYAPASVTVCRIDEQHGNPLKLWEEMGSPTEMSQDEIVTLKEHSAVIEEPWQHTFFDHSIKINVKLGVNDLYFIRIR
ncbi:MAG: hypothetical protein IKN04_12965 [Clostridia bacterium]|nr:hypothetical protein [Clostridia bacterium]